MKIVYANQSLPSQWSKSIFLAGPTPRDPETPSWRPDALRALEEQGYDGVVFVPETSDKQWHHDYIDQVGWEEECLNAADCILFWVPRDLKTMPAFTTNIEFGFWADSGKAVVGFPKDAPKTKYIKHYCDKLKIPNSNTLDNTVKNAVEFVGNGILRKDGARKVPLYIFKTPHFQKWYRFQIEEVGNRLDDARVLWNYRVGEQRKFPFFWAIHVDIFVTEENRNKSNEIIISRPDISSVLAFKPRESLMDCEVCLVKEFRSPGTTDDGFIWELPSGSSAKLGPLIEDMFGVASEELEEETGLKIPLTRFQVASCPGVGQGYHTRRQLAGTSSTHGSHLFIVQLTDEELEYLKSQKDIPHGEANSSERTFVEVVTVRDILTASAADGWGDKFPICDWSTIGMILSVLANRYCE